MEKEKLLLEGEDMKQWIEPKPKAIHLLTKSQVAILVIGVVVLVLFAPLPQWPPNDVPLSVLHSLAPFNDTIGNVQWAPCTGMYDLKGSECGYIVVPKDYFNVSAGTVRLALGRLPARKKESKGSILFNPGGPGGAGKAWITRRGSMLQTYVGDEYDLVGFDPRGIGESVPKIQCFNRAFTYANFKHNTVLERSFNFPSNVTVKEIRQEILVQQREADSLLKTVFDVCHDSMNEELKYMGTASVVRDMDFITKSLDGPGALINFYGVSYGSILGQYLVNMLPDRIGRVVIDGVADAVAWSEKPSYQWYRQWLMSTENNYDQFVVGCSKGGPDVCALAQHVSEEPFAIKARIEAFVNELYHKPLPVPSARHPGVLTIGRVRAFIQLGLLRPIAWPTLASEIHAAMNGDGSYILDALEPKPDQDLERLAVSCNDNRPLLGATPEEVVDELLFVYQNVSRFVFSVVTTEPDAGCEHWPVTPPERFQGPWNHTLRNPILVLSNTEDPVTPLDSALKVQDLLGDSARLLLQDGPGHVTLALPSLCTAQHVQTFFRNGTLPAKETLCKPDITPFPNPEDENLSLSGRKLMLVYAMTALHDAFLSARSIYYTKPSMMRIPRKKNPRVIKNVFESLRHEKSKVQTHVEPTPVHNGLRRQGASPPQQGIICRSRFAGDVMNRFVLISKLFCS